MEEPVTIIDRDVLKVLSVDTRMDIIKILSEGSRTPSDISKKLNKSDATIVEHLDIMVKTGLVKKIEQPGKKWVFYTLTERGQGIISSKSRKLVIILSTSLLVLFGGLFMKMFTQPVNLSQRAASTAAEKTLGEGAQIASQYQSIVSYIPLVLIVLGTLGVIFYIHQKSKFKEAKI